MELFLIPQAPTQMLLKMLNFFRLPQGTSQRYISLWCINMHVDKVSVILEKGH